MTDAETEQIEQFLKHAEAQMMQAEFADADGKEALFHEAKDHLIRAEQIMPGSGAWLMSCIHARANNGALCVKWLERARKSSTLPDMDTVLNHAHFSKVVTEKWFVAWLKSGQ